MRFTTGQEPGDRAELGHNRLPNNLDESMMAAGGCNEPIDGGCVEEGSMISNLPLLFADGYPTSLEKITMIQLERFITFMVQCSFGHDTAKVIKEPQWWPKEIKFTNPFVRPRRINENWMGILKKLVFRCYTYHRSEYLLRFCSHLAQHPRDKLEYHDNWDSTTSLFHKSTGKLLVTFRNENMNYDKKIESPRRLLLPRNVPTTGPTGKTKNQQQRTMVQPVLCDDIYLCDNCDAELDGLQKMKEHEKLCCDQEQSSGSSRPVSPEVSSGPQDRQNQFLEYFSLSSNDGKALPLKITQETTSNTKSDGIRSSRRIRGSVNLARCPTIPFSSPAGIAMAKKSRTMTEVTQQERLERIERYLIAPPLSNGSRPRWLDRVNDVNRWTVSHKPNRDKPSQDSYVHEYKFNSFRGKPMLNVRSQILCVACRKAIVPLALLTPQHIENLRNNPYRYDRAKRKSQLITTNRSRPAPKSKRGLFNQLVTNEKRKCPGGVEEKEGTSFAEGKKICQQTIESEKFGTKSSSSPKAKKVGLFLDKEKKSSVEKCSRILLKGAEKVENENRIIEDNVGSAVAVIDLCSSDEEENDSTTNTRTARVDGDKNDKKNTCDENMDPLNKNVDNNRGVSSTVIKNFTPSKKIRLAPCVYPADSTSDWLKMISEPCSEFFE